MLNFKKKTVKNLCLIGLMGSGKSVIGRDLSRALNINFIDTDYEIEKEAGMSINSIFKKYGEVYFRNLEEKICVKVLKKIDCVISLGGGSILNKNIRNTIKENSCSIFLNVDIDIILNRIKHSNKRPLLDNKDKKKTLENLYKERIKYYKKCDLVLSNNLDRKELVRKIKSEIIKYE